MKKVIFFLAITFLMQSYGLTQNWSSVYESYDYSAPTAVELFNNSIIAVGVSVCDENEVVFFNDKGEKVDSVIANANVMQATDSLIYALGYEFYDVAGMDKISLTRFDVNGVVDTLFVLPEETEPHTFGQMMVPVTMDIADNGTVIASGPRTAQNFTLKTNVNGKYSWYKEIDISSALIDNYILSDTSYLYIAEDGIYLSDSSAVLTDSLMMDGLIDGYVKDNSAFVLTTSQIYQLDMNLEPKDTILLPEEVVNAYAFEQTGNDFHVLANFGDKTNVFQISAEGNLLNQYDLTYPFTPAFFELTQDNIYLVSQTPSAQTGVASFQLVENSQLDYPDVTISEVLLENIETIFLETSQVYRFFVHAAITVRNRGNMDIDSLGIRITDSRLTDYYCFDENQAGSYETFGNLNIAPNDSVVLDVSMAIGNYTEIIDTVYPCFEAKAPNAQIEVDTALNTMCARYIFTDVPSLTLDDAIDVYPNPAHKTLVVDLTEVQTPPQSIQVFNNNGELIMEISETENLEPINISHLPPGIYILKIALRNQVVAKKFIKR